MAKKKNRQKEFKRKQKLMIKVISEEEIALTDSLGYQPVFVERRKIQNFDEQNTAMTVSYTHLTLPTTSRV